MTTPYRENAALEKVDESRIPTPTLSRRRLPNVSQTAVLAAWAAALVTLPHFGQMGLAAAITLGLFGIGSYERQRALLLKTEWNRRALMLIRIGALDAAAKYLASVVRASERWPRTHAAALAMFADVRLRQNRVGEARELLRVVEASDRLELKWWRVHVAVQAITAAACAGDLDDAEKRLVELEKLAGDLDKGDLLWVRTLVDVRRGRFPEAVERLKKEWFFAEGSLDPHLLRALRILRALAVGGDQAHAILATGQPYRKDEMAYLVHGWPELRALLEGYGPTKDTIT